MILSLFPSHRSPRGKKISLEDLLAKIQGEFWRPVVEPVRALEYNSREYQDAKHKLPVVTPSGYFPGNRAKVGLKTHTGLIGLDVDPKDHPGVDLVAKRKEVEADKHSLAVFSSVSGLGFLVLVQIPASIFPAWFDPEKEWVKQVQEVQTSFYDALETYYLQTFGLKTDGSCIDVSRARYVSYDTNLYYNQDAKVWEGRQFPQPKAKPKPIKKQREKPTVANYGATVLERAERMVLDAAQGEKHVSLRNAAHLCGGYIASGCLDENEAYTVLYNAISSREGVDSMENAENLIRTGFSKGAESPVLPPYIEKRIINYAGSNLPADVVAVTVASEEGLDAAKIEQLVSGILDENSGVFWNVEFDERKGRNVIDIQRQKLVKWLVQQGFRAGANGKDLELYRIQDQIVSKVHPIHIAKFVTNYVEGLPVVVGELERTLIEEALLRSITPLFSPDLLRALQWFEGEFMKDTASTAFFYFKNCWVEVTAEGITAKEYDELPALIWDTQVKPWEFHPETGAPSNFHQFMLNITDNNAERLTALQRGLGYLMHGYKDIADARALILMDEVAEVGKSEGGTGKGLLMQAIRNMVPLVEIEGQSFGFDDKFRYERIQRDTKVVFFDEWDAQRLPFKSMFSMITGELVINPKHDKSFSLAFHESPKFAFGTNQVIVGEGSSYERRKIEILLKNYYSAKLRPIDEFKERFFYDWKQDQWNAFYQLALGWVQDFLANGLLHIENEGLEERILAQKAGVVGKEFVELVKELKAEKDRIWAAEVYQLFIESSGIEQKFFSLRKFNELMVFAGFLKFKWQERPKLGEVNHYQHTYFLVPRAAAPAPDAVPEAAPTPPTAPKNPLNLF
jgi:hypothetical protein